MVLRQAGRKLIDRLEVKVAFVPRDWRLGVYLPRRCTERSWPPGQGPFGIGGAVDVARRGLVLCPLPCVQVRFTVLGGPRPVAKPVESFPIFIEKSKVCTAVAAATVH